MADAIYSQADMDRRLDEARRAAREGAWLDIMGKFEPRDRRHIAGLLAHKWHVAAVTVACEWARPNTVAVSGFLPQDLSAGLDLIEKALVTASYTAPDLGKREQAGKACEALQAVRHALGVGGNDHKTVSRETPLPGASSRNGGGE